MFNYFSIQGKQLCLRNVWPKDNQNGIQPCTFWRPTSNALDAKSQTTIFTFTFLEIVKDRLCVRHLENCHCKKRI